MAAKKAQILVIGHNESGCTKQHEELARQAGSLVAQAGAILVTGGLGGVMKAASQGAQEAGGTVLGIIPGNSPDEANEFCHIVIPTGLGLSRDYVNALSADAVIVIGGGAGTLSEMCAAYMHGRPIIALAGTGGMADAYAGRHMDYRKRDIVRMAKTPKEAVDQAVRLARA